MRRGAAYPDKRIVAEAARLRGYDPIGDGAVRLPLPYATIADKAHMAAEAIPGEVIVAAEELNGFRVAVLAADIVVEACMAAALETLVAVLDDLGGPADALALGRTHRHAETYLPRNSDNDTRHETATDSAATHRKR